MRGVLLIRHSNTTYDNKVDALLNPPLDEEGSERFARTIKFLREGDYPFSRIVSSPLQRALLAAERLADQRAKVTTHNEALPWNLGDLQGKPNAKVQPAIDFLLNYPDIKAPHGESYRTFLTRWSDFLFRLLMYAEAKPEEYLVVTTHSRNINALQEIIGGAPVGDVKETTPEASVTLLAQTGLGDLEYKILWEGK